MPQVRETFQELTLVVQYFDLSSINLRGCNLNNANLKNTSLKDANLQQANLSYANLEQADLKDTKFDGAIFYNTITPDGSIKNDNL